MVEPTKINKPDINLTHFDFTEFEIEMYLTLLALGEATIDECVKIANVKRTTAYSVAKDLAEMGLIEVSLSKPLRYRVLPPRETLYPILKKRIEVTRQRIKQMETTIVDFIDEAESVYKENATYLSSDRDFLVIKGPYLTRKLTWSVAHKAETMRILSRFPILFEYGSPRKRRQSQVNIFIIIETKMLENEEFLSRVSESFEKSNFNIRHLSSLPSKMVIYDDYASLLTIRSVGGDYGSHLESVFTFSKDVVKLHIHAFEALWEKAEPVTKEDLEKYGKKS